MANIPDYEPKGTFLTPNRLDKVAKDIVYNCKKDRREAQKLYDAMSEIIEDASEIHPDIYKSYIESLTNLISIKQNINDKLIKIFTSAQKTRLDEKKIPTTNKPPEVHGGKHKMVDFSSLRNAAKNTPENE